MTEREQTKAVVADYMMGTLTSDEASLRIMSILGMDGLTGEQDEAKQILEDGLENNDPIDAILDEIDDTWELDPLDSIDDDDDYDYDFEEDEEPVEPESRS